MVLAKQRSRNNSFLFLYYRFTNVFVCAIFLPQTSNHVFILGTNMTSLVRRAEIYFPNGADGRGYTYGELVSSYADNSTELMSEISEIGRKLDDSVRRVPWLEDIDKIADEGERDEFLDMALLVGAMIGNPRWRRDIFWDAFLEANKMDGLTEEKEMGTYKAWKRELFNKAKNEIRKLTRAHAINSQAFFRVLSEFDSKIQAREIEESSVLQYEMGRVNELTLQGNPYDKNRLMLKITVAELKLKREIELGIWTPNGLHKDAFKKSLLERSVRAGDVKKKKNADELVTWDDHRTPWYICNIPFHGMVLYDSGNSGYNRTKVVEGRREDLKKQSSFQHTIDGMKTTLTFQNIEKLDKELTGKERKLEQLKTELRNAREEAKICTFEIERVYIPYQGIGIPYHVLSVIKWKTEIFNLQHSNNKTNKCLELVTVEELRALLKLNDIKVDINTGKKQMISDLREKVENNNISTIFKLELRGERLRAAVEELVPEKVRVVGDELKSTCLLNTRDCAAVFSRYNFKSTGTNLKDSKALIKEKKLHILDQSARITETIERLEREKHEITSSNGNNNLMDT